MNTFADLMHDARAERGLTLAQLAQETGYDTSYLSLAERGKRNLNDEGVVRVARVLGIDPGTALLAALRQRLPANLRTYVPTGLRGDAPGDRVSVARELQSEHFDYEVGRFDVNGILDWDGNARIVRVFEDCRPQASGKPVWQIVFRERAMGVRPTDERSKIAVRAAPPALEYEAGSEVLEPWLVHRLAFPRGWRRTPQRGQDSLSFAFETYHEAAYSFDPRTTIARAAAEGLRPHLQGFSFHAKHFIGRLRVCLDFPSGYTPAQCEPWVWWGTDLLDTVTRNLGDKGTCRSMEFTHHGSRAELLVNQPLAGYMFAITWAPGDRLSYLDARFGGPQ